MYINLQKLIIQNFKSFQGKVTFYLDRGQPGLYFLTGVNKTNKDMGSNGAGKTSIWDALFWCLYGCTTDKVRSSNVKNWHSRGVCSVTLDLLLDKVEYKIYRSWGPIKLIVNGHDRTQEEINTLIGLNGDEFLHGLLMSQGGDTFMDLKPASKLSLFNDLIHLSIWTDASAEASKTTTEKNLLSEKTANKLTTEQQTLTTLRSSIAAFRTAKKQQDKEQAATVSELETKLESTIQDRQDNKTKRGKLAKQLAKLEELLDTLTKTNKDLKAKRLDLARQQDAKDDEIKEISYKISTGDQQIRSLRSIGSKCPTCFQTVDKTTRSKHVKHIKTENEKLGEEKERLSKAYEKLTRQQYKLLEESNELNEQILDVEQEIRRLGKESAVLINNAKSLKDKITEIKSDLKTARSKKSSLTTDITETKQKIVDQKTLIASTKELADQQSRDSVTAKFWVQGFKDIRLQVLKQALGTLNVETNNSLDSLGLGGWEIEFDVERETKAKNISHGFHTKVMSPTSPAKVPWELWSGGEAQRLRLASAIGLSGLLLGTKGLSCNIEIYDEPTTHLSEQGIEDLLNCLYDRALMTGKQLWLVDQHTLDYGVFTEVVSVVNTKKLGSIIK